MHIKNINYPNSFNPTKKIFYEFDSFISFFEINKKYIKSVKINPPKIGAKDFGSIQVIVKHK